MPLNLKSVANGSVILTPASTATDKTITIPATDGTMVVQDSSNITSVTNLAYTGTLTGGTGVINIGSGQVYKDASGNVGIGTGSPLTTSGVYNSLSIGGAARGLIELRNASNQQRALFYINGDGNVDFGGQGSFSLVFRTDNTERMRIDSSGNLLVGTTSVARGAKLTVNGNLSVPAVAFGATTSNVFLYEGATNEFTVRTGAAGVEKFFAFNTAGRFSALSGPCAGVGAYIDLSDARSKENITLVPYGLAEILQLKPSMFSFIGQDTKELGFIAQEVQEVVPEAVTYFDNERLGLQTSSLISVVVKAIQELKAEFDAYKLSHP